MNKFYDEKLQNKYGKYLLFPSSFSVYHASGEKNQLKNLKNLKRINTKEDLKLVKERDRFFKKTFDKYYGLADKIASKFTDYLLIVRPHPSEDRSTWKKLTKKHSNVLLKTNYPAASWIIGAECIIHSSCTTGLEAFLLNKPVLSYLPYKDHEFVEHISNEMSIECNSSNEVIHQLKLLREKENIMQSGRGKRIKILESFISNLDGTSAYENILKEIKKIKIPGSTFKKFPLKAKGIFFFKNILKFITSNLGEKKYNQQKMPGITKKEMKKNINKYQNMLPDLREINFSNEKIAKDLFFLEYKNKSK